MIAILERVIIFSDFIRKATPCVCQAVFHTSSSLPVRRFILHPTNGRNLHHANKWFGDFLADMTKKRIKKPFDFLCGRVFKSHKKNQRTD